MIPILTVIAPLFLIIFVSAILQKFEHVGDDWGKVLNEFAIKIGLPVLIFTALAKTTFSFQEEASLIVANSVFILVSFLLAIAVGRILRLNKQMFLTLFICFVFGDIAYLGIPVITQTSGPAVLPIVSLIVGVYLFWMFTVGIGYLDYSIFEKKRDVVRQMLRNFVKNPLLLSVILGILIGSLKITIPTIIMTSLEMVSASVTPVVLVVIGLFIGNLKIGKISEWTPVFIFSIFTLFILPAAFYFGVKLFGYNPAEFSISILEAAMPLAITPFALADQYKLNKTFIARSIVLSTILSAISLPIWVMLIK